MPYSYSDVAKKVSFYRKNFLNNKYPLNSSMNLSLKKLYALHNLDAQNNEFCSGVLLYNIEEFKDYLKNIYYKYSSNIKSITNNGEQTHLNYELISRKKVFYLDYKFQSIWPFEMASNFQFLYQKKYFFNLIASLCIENTLMRNYFLHFPGSWVEGQMWKNKFLISILKKNKFYLNFQNYLKKRIKGKDLGIIAMKKKN